MFKLLYYINILAGTGRAQLLLKKYNRGIRIRCIINIALFTLWYAITMYGTYEYMHNSDRNVNDDDCDDTPHNGGPSTTLRTMSDIMHVRFIFFLIALYR